MKRLTPGGRREENTRKNLLHLEVRERLTALGHDPNLADYLEADAQAFSERLRAFEVRQREAYVDAEVDVLTSMAETQAEMNEAAFDRVASVNKLIERRTAELLETESFSNAAVSAVNSSHLAWKDFREKDALAEAVIVAEGGSIFPVVFGGAMEREGVTRIGRLKTLQCYPHNPENYYVGSSS